MTITKIELQELYENNSNAYVCEKLGISVPTLLRYLRDAGIPLKGSGQGRMTTDKKIKVVE